MPPHPCGDALQHNGDTPTPSHHCSPRWARLSHPFWTPPTYPLKRARHGRGSLPSLVTPPAGGLAKTGGPLPAGLRAQRSLAQWVTLAQRGGDGGHTAAATVVCVTPSGRGGAGMRWGGGPGGAPPAPRPRPPHPGRWDKRCRVGTGRRVEPFGWVYYIVGTYGRRGGPLPSLVTSARFRLTIPAPMHTGSSLTAPAARAMEGTHAWSPPAVRSTVLYCTVHQRIFS